MTSSPAFVRPVHRVAGVLLVCAPAFAQLDPKTPGLPHPANVQAPLPNRDIRLSDDGRPAAWVGETNAELRTRSELAARAADVRGLRARIPLLRIDDDPVFGTPRWVGSMAHLLTEPAPGDLFDAAAVVRAFVAAHRGLFEIDAGELDAARRSRDYLTRDVGTRHLTFQQTIDGIDLFGAELRANVDRHGRLVNVSSTMLPRPEGGFAAGPRLLSAARAIRAAAGCIGARVTVEPVAAGAACGVAERQAWAASPDFRSDLPVTTELVFFPLSRADIRAAWKVFLPEIGIGNDYEVVVDASDGKLLWRRNDLQFLAGGTQDLTLLVYPKDSPAPGSPCNPTPSGAQFPFVSRASILVSPELVPQSPNSWINDGDNDTQGNNVDAHLDLDGDNQPDLPRPTGTPFRSFSFRQDNTLPPTSWREASVVNLFYLCNVYHDRLYSLGFDEEAGNFQTDNFGQGGFGNDRVLADAQDGLATNNANFATPPDGTSGRMQQYVFTGPNPHRDSSLDADVVFHEHSHGLSNRLHNLALTGVQTEGMGEGWSDYFAVSLNADATDDPDAVYCAGGYISLQFAPGFVDNYYFGIRRFPYSTDLDKNPTTYADTDPAQESFPTGVPRSPIVGNTANEAHNIGEIWCNTLLEMRARLWRKYGFIGNDRAMQLVVDGMKLDPGDPDFLQARDAILQADVVRYAGADLDDILTAFAKRGCGYSATSPGGSTTNGIVEAFDLPIAFAYPAGLPVQLEPNAPTTFPVEISGVGTLQPLSGTGTLYVSIDDGPFNPIAMSETSPNHYDATLPASACFDELRFYVYTATTLGSAVNPPGGQADPYSADVYTSTQSIFYDDFQTDLGWTTSVNLATTGAWERGVPVNTPGWAYDPLSDADGSGQCYVTMNQAGNSDVDNGSVTLTSPVLDMTGGADISYAYYLYLTDESGCDRLLVEIDSNGGAGPWTAIATHTSSGSSSWRTNTVSEARLTALGVTFTANMKIRFTANDADPQSVVEAGVDAVSVQRKLCGPTTGTSFCAGDGSGPACPCSNNGHAGNGCENSYGTGGARLVATGTTSPDTVMFAGSGEKPDSTTIFVQGDAAVSPVHYGDGLRCVGGTTKRLYVKLAGGGFALAPAGSDLSVTARSAALGDPIAPGSTRYYFLTYRNADPNFCPPPVGGTFNSTNAIEITW